MSFLFGGEAKPDTPIDQITHIASTSPVAGYRWKGNRGVAPAGYIKGMALTYARVYCKLKAGEAAATDMAKVDTRDNEHDALSWYRQKFAELELSNDTAGPDTLRLCVPKFRFCNIDGEGRRERVVM